MFYRNRVDFIGRAVKDAEVKNVGESKVATFRLVSNRRIKKRDGNYEEKPTYIDCEAWNQRATYIGEYVKKGTPVMVCGQLETDEWTSKDGQPRSKLKIYVNEVQAERYSSNTSSQSESSSDEKAKEEAVSDIPF